MASAAVYGEALLLGQRPEAKALAAELRAFSDGYLDGPALRAEAAGITAGSWYASPASHVGHELIAAGMLILAGGGMARHWTMTSWSGGRGSVLTGISGTARRAVTPYWTVLRHHGVANCRGCMVQRHEGTSANEPKANPAPLVRGAGFTVNTDVKGVKGPIFRLSPGVSTQFGLLFANPIRRTNTSTMAVVVNRVALLSSRTKIVSRERTGLVDDGWPHQYPRVKTRGPKQRRCSRASI